MLHFGSQDPKIISTMQPNLDIEDAACLLDGRHTLDKVRHITVLFGALEEPAVLPARKLRKSLNEG